MSLWRMEWGRTLRQKENYVFFLTWLLVLVLLGGLGQALPIAAEYTNVGATLITVLGLLLPLFILLTTALHWGQERESKRLNLLSTFTFPGWKLIWIRYSAFIATQLLVSLLAFMTASLVVELSWKMWGGLFAYASGLIVYAAALGTLLGLVGRSRIRAILLAFLTWVFLVLLWPTLLVAVIAWLPYGMQVNGMIVALFLNGFDLLRVWVSVTLSSPESFGNVYIDFLSRLDRPIGHVVVWFALFSTSLLFLGGASKLVFGGNNHDSV